MVFYSQDTPATNKLLVEKFPNTYDLDLNLQPPNHEGEFSPVWKYLIQWLYYNLKNFAQVYLNKEEVALTGWFSTPKTRQQQLNF